MIEIPLTQGQIALIDEIDYGLVSLYAWTARRDKGTGAWCALATVSERPGTWKSLYMHALILKTFDGRLVDHIDHNELNNCRYNIRVATKSQNLMNMRKRSNRSSVYKGVVLRSNGKWRARISRSGIQFHLGFFESEEEAALAYNEAAKDMFGEFALLNDIELHQ